MSAKCFFTKVPYCAQVEDCCTYPVTVYVDGDGKQYEVFNIGDHRVNAASGTYSTEVGNASLTDCWKEFDTLGDYLTAEGLTAE